MDKNSRKAYQQLEQYSLQQRRRGIFVYTNSPIYSFLLLHEHPHMIIKLVKTKPEPIEDDILSEYKAEWINT